MAGYVVRKLSLTTVLVAGVASIVATSPPPPPYYFREATVAPAYRCPGSDVSLRWSLNQPAPVTVTVNGQNFRQDAETNGMTVKADILDGIESPAEATLRIDRPEADYAESYQIETLARLTAVTVFAHYVGGDESEMLLDLTAWDERIRIVGVEIEGARNLVCEAETYPTPWRIEAPTGERLLRYPGTGESGRIDRGPPAGGVWHLRPHRAQCTAPTYRTPELRVRLAAECS